jgi:hypothetical protein
MPGARFARVLMFIIAIAVVLGLVLSTVAAPLAY